ncbi:MAG: STAS domain-containing protein [Thermoleophilaceae bacterium]|jgi:anti-anti-sigma factor|nr:STAS domain-containing protein [Thermoleophilaceae bacterium]
MTELGNVEVREEEGVVVAQVSGELDLSNSPATGKAIEAALPASARALVVDFTGLTFLDSSGVAMLFGLVRRLGDHRQQLHVVAPEGEAVGRVLEIVDFGRAAPVYAVLDAALDAARGA